MSPLVGKGHDYPPNRHIMVLLAPFHCVVNTLDRQDFPKERIRE